MARVYHIDHSLQFNILANLQIVIIYNQSTIQSSLSRKERKKTINLITPYDTGGDIEQENRYPQRQILKPNFLYSAVELAFPKA